METKKPKFYAVREGRKTGIFTTWTACREAIHGYSGAVYKSFDNNISAQEWFEGVSLSSDRADFPDGYESKSSGKGNFAADYDVYTDGSYSNGRYSWAYAFVKDGQVVFEDNAVGKNPDAAVMRNVAGEIAAVLYAVKKAASLGVRIRIFHDYAGIAFWVTGEWAAKNEFTQIYAGMMKKHQGIYQFQKVKSHTGDTFNEYVDKKAKEALGIGE